MPVLSRTAEVTRWSAVRRPRRDAATPSIMEPAGSVIRVQVLSAKGGAQSHADVAQGAPDIPCEVVPEITKGVHGSDRRPQPYGAIFAHSRYNEILNRFLIKIQRLTVKHEGAMGDIGRLLDDRIVNKINNL